MGVIIGLGAAVCFSLSAICARIGQRRQYEDDGIFMSVLVNVLVLGSAAVLAPVPPWNLAGFLGLVAGGLLGTVGGRSTNLRAVRLIGPSRANAFLTGTPLPAALFGWLALDEGIGLVDGIGGLLVIAGLLWLVRARSTATSLVAPGESRRGHTPLAGYLFAVAAPTFFGLAFVARKWGLVHFPSAVLGAFIGAVSAFTGVMLLEAGRGNLRTRLRSNFPRIPWWFVGTGLATSAALLLQFTAFSYLPAWVVGILQGTQAVWTLLFSWLFIRAEERIDRAVVGCVLLVVAGVALIGLQ